MYGDWIDMTFSEQDDKLDQDMGEVPYLIACSDDGAYCAEVIYTDMDELHNALGCLECWGGTLHEPGTHELLGDWQIVPTSNRKAMYRVTITMYDSSPKFDTVQNDSRHPDLLTEEDHWDEPDILPFPDHPGDREGWLSRS